MVEDEVKYLECREPSDPIWNRLSDTYKEALLRDAKTTGVVPAGTTDLRDSKIELYKGQNKVFGQICGRDNNATAVADRAQSMCPVNVSDLDAIF